MNDLRHCLASSIKSEEIKFDFYRSVGRSMDSDNQFNLPKVLVVEVGVMLLTKIATVAEAAIKGVCNVIGGIFT